ncbi:hypothetical protein F5Y19DRAFT_459760, partial [Xylariaceae sp. FL1651]
MSLYFLLSFLSPASPHHLSLIPHFLPSELTGLVMKDAAQHTTSRVTLFNLVHCYYCYYHMYRAKQVLLALP